MPHFWGGDGAVEPPESCAAWRACGEDGSDEPEPRWGIWSKTRDVNQKNTGL